jgi:hypothetical protein
LALAGKILESRLVLDQRPLAQIAPVVVQEIEGPHAEPVIVSVEMQPEKIRQAVAAARHKLAVDDE